MSHHLVQVAGIAVLLAVAISVIAAVVAGPWLMRHTDLTASTRRFQRLRLRRLQFQRLRLRQAQLNQLRQRQAQLNQLRLRLRQAQLNQLRPRRPKPAVQPEFDKDSDHQA